MKTDLWGLQTSFKGASGAIWKVVSIAERLPTSDNSKT